MDSDLLHTFLELEEAGTMGTAAERLFVTQATVSARIAQLEEQVGQRLFERSKSGTRLTSFGKQFLPYAQQMLGLWHEAVHELGNAEPAAPRLRIGGEYTLATSLLLNWLVELRESRPTVHLVTAVDGATRLLDAVQDGRLDIVVLYSPLRRKRVKTQQVLKEELICVSTEPGCRRVDPSSYIHVDWGPDFGAQHDRALPELQRPVTTIELGPLALRYLLRVGGTGYFRTRAVEPYLKAKRLHRVSQMPTFSYSIYAVSGAHVPPELLEWAVHSLVASARQKVEAWA